MAHVDPILSTAPVTGVAEPPQSTIAGILHAVEQALFSPVEAETLIDRVRAHVTTVSITVSIAVSIAPPSSVEDDRPSASTGRASHTLPNDPERKF